MGIYSSNKRMNLGKKVCSGFAALALASFILFFTGLPAPIAIEIVYDDAKLHSHQSLQSDTNRGLPRAPPRSADNGAWYAVPGEYEIYLYTAFYDNRVSIGSLPSIRIIAVAQELESVPPLFCVVNYAGEIGKRHNEVKRIDIGAGAYRHDKILKEYILNCQLHSEHIPLSVGVVLSNFEEPEFMVPVEYPEKNVMKKPLAACVSVSYWMIEPYKIVEWMEMQRILGMDKIIVYNNSLSPVSAKIFQHYAKTDFLEFRQSHNFISDSGEQTFHLHMSPVINDCMYRFMYQFKNLVIIDLDEFIIPHSNNTLNEMIQTIEHMESEFHATRSYVLRNAYFFFDYKPDVTQHQRLRTLRYRVRQNVSETGYSAKSIIDPLSCFAMHNHYCWGVNKLYEDGYHMAFVKPEVALLHHYKKCHIDMFEVKIGECKKITKSGVQDDAMLKYRDKLILAVEKQLGLLGL